jgi:hypothetical protein
MVLSDCLVDLSLQTDSPNMYVGTIFNIPESTYSLKITYQKCDGVLITDNYATMEVRKGGALIDVHDFHPGGDPVLFDNNTLCIALGVFECQPIDPAQWWTAYRIGYNPDLCLNVSCSDKCYGSDLWSMKCDPATGLCVQDTLKEPNSLICTTATHYIEYDFSFLPQSFLDLISSNIVDLSNFLGTHLPIPSNIQWIGASYSGGRFGIYVKYTPPSQSPAAMGPEQIALPQMALSTFVGMIAGLIVFVVAQRLTTVLSVVNPLAPTIIGAALGIVAWVSLGYIIYEFSTGTSTPGTASPTAPVDKSKAVDEYLTNYVIPFCNSQYPGCAAVPATCDGPTYRTYAACIQKIAQCQYDAALHRDPVTTCDPRVQEYKDIDTGLANGTMSVTEAQNRTTTNNTTINNYHNYVIQTMTCPSGQTYDPTTQKCVAGAEDCWIPAPLGGCILSASTGKTIAIIGGVVIGGILIISLVKK